MYLGLRLAAGARGVLRAPDGYTGAPSASAAVARRHRTRPGDRRADRSEEVDRAGPGLLGSRRRCGPVARTRACLLAGPEAQIGLHPPRRTAARSGASPPLIRSTRPGDLSRLPGGSFRPVSACLPIPAPTPRRVQSGRRPEPGPVGRTRDEGGSVKAVVYEGPRQVSVKDVPDARIERPTDVLVRITSANICGSDLHMYEGRTDFEPGRWFGHENLGQVVEVGDGVDKVQA